MAPVEQVGVRCLDKGFRLNHDIEGEGWNGSVHSLPPPTIPAGPETRTHNLWITSLTETCYPRAVPRTEIRPIPRLKWPFKPDKQKSAFSVMDLNSLGLVSQIGLRLNQD